MDRKLRGKRKAQEGTKAKKAKLSKGIIPSEVEEVEFELPEEYLAEVRLESDRRSIMENNGEAMREMGREMSRALAEGLTGVLHQQNDTIRDNLEITQRNTEETRDAGSAFWARYGCEECLSSIQGEPIPGHC
jgi:hypothetical protein